MVLSAAFAAELLAAAGGSVERVEKLGLDDVEITSVERIEPGTEIGGTKAAGGAVLVKARARPPSKVNIAILPAGRLERHLPRQRERRHGSKSVIKGGGRRGKRRLRLRPLRLGHRQVVA